MLTIKFDRGAKAIGDLDVMSFAEDVASRANKSDVTIVVSQWIVIDAIRVMIREGKLTSEVVFISSNGTECYFSKSGQLYDWPEESHIYDNILRSLVSSMGTCKTA